MINQHLVKTAPSSAGTTRGARIIGETAASVTVFSPGKVNLYLRVGPVLADSGDPRHQLLTVFQCLELGETLQLTPLGTNSTKPGRSSTGDGVADTVETHLAQGLSTEKHLDGPGNLVYKTLQLLREASGVAFPPTHVRVDKKIPIAGGLAGGSADAAGTIVGVNRLYQLGLSAAQQLELAARLGADVPALLLGGNSVGIRFGDILEPLPASTKRHWVLALADTGLSTPQVFRELDRAQPHLAPLSAALPEVFLNALEAETKVFADQLANDLEAPALALRPELQTVKTAARQAGAVAALISGSGPTVACLCEDGAAAEHVYAKLRDNPLVHLAIKTTGPN